MVVSGKQLELTIQKNLLLAAAARQRLDSNAQPEATLKTTKSRRVSPCLYLACNPPGKIRVLGSCAVCLAPERIQARAELIDSGSDRQTVCCSLSPKSCIRKIAVTVHAAQMSNLLPATAATASSSSRSSYS